MRSYWISLLIAAMPMFASDQQSAPALNLPHPSATQTTLQRTASPTAVAPTTSNQAQSDELKPNPHRQTFHISGDSRDVIAQVCSTYGITASFDESVAKRKVNFDLDDATWPVAMSILQRLTKTFWTPFSVHQALFAADTPGNRSSLERSFLRTFYLSEFATPKTLNEITAALREIFELRSVTVDLDANSITVRTDAETMDAVVHLLQELKGDEPQVMLDVDVFQVSSSFIRSFGVTVPTQFQLFYIPTAPASAQIAQSVAASTTLDNFNFGTKNIGLALPSASVGAAQSQSAIRTLDRVNLRASQGEPATLKIGERYPIVTSTYSSISNNQAFQVPPPTFSYVDIGFELKATPTIHGDGTIGIRLELQLNALGTQNTGGMPEILNSEFTGFVSAKDGEPIVAAGNILKSTVSTRSGWPGLDSIFGLRDVFSTVSKQSNDDELLIVVTPHIITRTKTTSFAYRLAR